ncbi:MmgE/PrpD family protein [Chloroflexota bacterium]
MVTEGLSQFIVDTTYDRIPRKAVETAKWGILDCIGVTLAGSLTPEVSIIEEYLKETGGIQVATVVGRRLGTTAPQAALINGVSAHSLDYDGTNKTWRGHPSVVLLPLVLALGEKMGATGKEVILAYIIGFEIGAKISSGITDHYDFGWHSTGTIGTMGGAAAASKLLGLDVDKVRATLGMAASMSSGSRQNFGTMTKPFHAGMAAHNGIVAALLVKKGYTAATNIIEAPMGFAKLMSGNGEINQEKMTQNLGNPFDITSAGFAIKPYPCCRFTHRCIDAILSLIKEYQIKADQVSKIVCKTTPAVKDVLIHPRPKSGQEAKFSMQYCMAVALLDGKIGLEQFVDERVNKPDVQSIISKVYYDHDGQPASINEARMVPEEVLVRLQDGTEYRQAITTAKGEPDNPMKEEEITAKYRDCASQVLTSGNQERTLQLILGLESLDKISKLMQLLRPTD